VAEAIIEVIRSGEEEVLLGQEGGWSS